MANPKKFPTITLTPSASRSGKYSNPVPHLVSVINNPNDHGQDYQGKVGSSVVAIGNATVSSVTPDPTGFGEMVIYTLTSGPATGTQIYVGHAQPVAGLHVGQSISQGDAVATLVPAGTIPGSNASQDGWTEIGIAENGQPKYAKGIIGGAEFKKVLGLKLTPTESAASSTYQSTVTAQTQANSPGYVAATTDISVIKAQALAAAKATAHVSDPWITVTKNSKGVVTGFGESTGENAPGNVLTIGGLPATKAVFQQAWSNTYQADYEAFTGKAATPGQMADILENGTSVYTLKQQLAKQPGFKSSPIFKAQGPGVAAAGKQLLGQAPPATFVAQAIGQGWDSNTITANLRKLPQYVNGPEYKALDANFTDTYTQIYGSPAHDTKAAIHAHIIDGWTSQQFAAKLRGQPEYAKSAEAHEAASGLVGLLGLDLNPAARLPVAPPIPIATPATGGTTHG